ncbi:sodium/calcium exchanger 3-like isoform X2 [Daktulosphaira vitifoliae]|nr:sodium/calcium exchanger 3-like isoform X2 [Daktulosphaira vitifoliae]
MALGTSLPEILLSIIEIVGHNFEVHKLGPNIIVGSAAFNLLIITSLCTLSLKPNESKRIYNLEVFLVIGTFSFISYLWLMFIIDIISPSIIELWEASVTFMLFPIFILFAYAIDKRWYSINKHHKYEIDVVKLEDQNQPMYNKNEMDEDNLLAFLKNASKFPDVTELDVAKLAAVKIMDSTYSSSIRYRIREARRLSGRTKRHSMLDGRLRQLYDVLMLNESNVVTNTLSSISADEKCAVVEFCSHHIAIRENIGKYPVKIWRHGNLKTKCTVRIHSLDGTAKEGEDYIKVNEIINFKENEEKKQIFIEIIDDDKWEPDENFFLKLSLVRQKKFNVKIGSLSVMEVTIIDNDEPGIISFAKRGLFINEYVDFVEVPITRTHGSDGVVNVKWKITDRSAILGKYFVGSHGEIEFKDKEVVKVLIIKLINKMFMEKGEFFEVELFDISGGAEIGNFNKITITISRDIDLTMDRLVILTNNHINEIGLNRQTWLEQIKSAMTVNEGDLENATTFTYMLHFLSFFWKVLFSFIPPATIYHGWLRFFISLVLIGIMVTITDDLATILGCLIGLDDVITAITIVALGMSLPDILGACIVTQVEENADEAMIHIAGSITIKVLMGVGLPWFIAALHHYFNNSNFLILTNEIDINVFVYCTVAILAIAVLIIRRNVKFFGRAELGGPQNGRLLTAFIFITLWLIYILITSFKCTFR